MWTPHMCELFEKQNRLPDMIYLLTLCVCESESSADERLLSQVLFYYTPTCNTYQPLFIYLAVYT